MWSWMVTTESPFCTPFSRFRNVSHPLTWPQVKTAGERAVFTEDFREEKHPSQNERERLLDPGDTGLCWSLRRVPSPTPARRGRGARSLLTPCDETRATPPPLGRPRARQCWAAPGFISFSTSVCLAVKWAS